GAVPVRVDGGRPTHDVVVDPVLGVRGRSGHAVQPPVVGVVLAEQGGRGGPGRAGAGRPRAARRRPAAPGRPGRDGRWRPSRRPDHATGAWARPPPRTTCCGTRRSGARAVWPPRGRHWSPGSP